MPVAPPHPNAPAMIPVPVARGDNHRRRHNRHWRWYHHWGRDHCDRTRWRGWRNHAPHQGQKATATDSKRQDGSFHCLISGQPTPTSRRIKPRPVARKQAASRSPVTGCGAYLTAAAAGQWGLHRTRTRVRRCRWQVACRQQRSELVHPSSLGCIFSGGDHGLPRNEGGAGGKRTNFGAGYRGRPNRVCSTKSVCAPTAGPVQRTTSCGASPSIRITGPGCRVAPISGSSMG